MAGITHWHPSQSALMNLSPMVVYILSMVWSETNDNQIVSLSKGKCAQKRAFQLIECFAVEPRTLARDGRPVTRCWCGCCWKLGVARSVECRKNIEKWLYCQRRPHENTTARARRVAVVMMASLCRRPLLNKYYSVEFPLHGLPFTTSGEVVVPLDGHTEISPLPGFCGYWATSRR